MLAFVSLVFLLFAAPVRGNDASLDDLTASDRVTATREQPDYTNDVAPIIARACTQCHRVDGVAPFSLQSADDLLKRSRNIARAVRDGLMPPWFASTPSDARHRFKNDASLSAQDKATLLAWLESSDHPSARASGDVVAAPLAPITRSAWRIGEPDAILELPEAIEIKAEGTMPYVNVRVATNFESDKWIRAWEVIPSAREVVHHVLVFAVAPDAKNTMDVSSGFFAAFVPGGGMRQYDNTRAKLLPKGSTLVFQLHYTPNGRATSDRTKIGLVFAESAPQYEVRTAGIFDAKLDIPPNNASHEEGTSITVPADIRILSWMPHMHTRGKSFRASMTHASSSTDDGGVVSETGRSEILLDIPRYDFDWQLSYDYETPVDVAKGATLTIDATFDNSADNAENPDPTQRVRWGQQTTDEMLIGYLEYELRDGGAPIGGGRVRDVVADRARQFAAFDEDGDGAIERNEGGPAVRRSFDAADADHDDRVTRAEFDLFVSRSNPAKNR